MMPKRCPPAPGKRKSRRAETPPKTKRARPNPVRTGSPLPSSVEKTELLRFVDQQTAASALLRGNDKPKPVYGQLSLANQKKVVAAIMDAYRSVLDNDAARLQLRTGLDALVRGGSAGDDGEADIEAKGEHKDDFYAEGSLSAPASSMGGWLSSLVSVVDATRNNGNKNPYLALVNCWPTGSGMPNMELLATSHLRPKQGVLPIGLDHPHQTVNRTLSRYRAARQAALESEWNTNLELFRKLQPLCREAKVKRQHEVAQTLRQRAAGKRTRLREQAERYDNDVLTRKGRQEASICERLDSQLREAAIKTARGAADERPIQSQFLDSGCPPWAQRCALALSAQAASPCRDRPGPDPSEDCRGTLSIGELEFASARDPGLRLPGVCGPCAKKFHENRRPCMHRMFLTSEKVRIDRQREEQGKAGVQLTRGNKEGMGLCVPVRTREDRKGGGSKQFHERKYKDRDNGDVKPEPARDHHDGEEEEEEGKEDVEENGNGNDRVRASDEGGEDEENDASRSEQEEYETKDDDEKQDEDAGVQIAEKGAVGCEKRQVQMTRKDALRRGILPMTRKQEREDARRRGICQCCIKRVIDKERELHDVEWEEKLRAEKERELHDVEWEETVRAEKMRTSTASGQMAAMIRYRHMSEVMHVLFFAVAWRSARLLQLVPQGKDGPEHAGDMRSDLPLHLSMGALVAGYLFPSGDKSDVRQKIADAVEEACSALALATQGEVANGDLAANAPRKVSCNTLTDGSWKRGWDRMVAQETDLSKCDWWRAELLLVHAIYVAYKEERDELREAWEVKPLLESHQMADWSREKKVSIALDEGQWHLCEFLSQLVIPPGKHSRATQEPGGGRGGKPKPQLESEMRTTMPVWSDPLYRICRQGHRTRAAARLTINATCTTCSSSPLEQLLFGIARDVFAGHACKLKLGASEVDIFTGLAPNTSISCYEVQGVQHRQKEAPRVDASPEARIQKKGWGAAMARQGPIDAIKQRHLGSRLLCIFTDQSEPIECFLDHLLPAGQAHPRAARVGDYFSSSQRKADHAHVVETKLEKQVDTNRETNVETKLETKVKQKGDTNGETKVKQKGDTNGETKVQQKVETKVETKVEKNVESKVEKKVDRNRAANQKSRPRAPAHPSEVRYLAVPPPSLAEVRSMSASLPPLAKMGQSSTPVSAASTVAKVGSMPAAPRALAKVRYVPAPPSRPLSPIQYLAAPPAPVPKPRDLPAALTVAVDPDRDIMPRLEECAQPESPPLIFFPPAAIYEPFAPDVPWKVRRARP